MGVGSRRNWLGDLYAITPIQCSSDELDPLLCQKVPEMFEHYVTLHKRKASKEKKRANKVSKCSLERMKDHIIKII